MKLLFVILYGILLIGCQTSSVTEVGESELPQIETVQSEINDAWIEKEIVYIESLVGVEELESAKLALDNLLVMIDGGVVDQLQQARINTMISLLEVIETEKEFTGSDAVAIAMERYEFDEDIVFMYHNVPSYFGTDQSGYYVALKSLTLLEADEDNDGIILMLFVSDDGKIVEIE